MTRYITVDVPVIVEEGSEQYTRLVNLAEKMGVSLETAVRNVVGLGITHHINDNLPTWEKSFQS